mmetsp:Transcript_362/g.772  ORF Transcript_362/g.772 Transcript_362/m.772 type:complete len:115 (-) Transcript_362:758-1102(-)
MLLICIRKLSNTFISNELCFMLYLKCTHRKWTSSNPYCQQAKSYKRSTQHEQFQNLIVRTQLLELFGNNFHHSDEQERPTRQRSEDSASQSFFRTGTSHTQPSEEDTDRTHDRK